MVLVRKDARAMGQNNRILGYLGPCRLYKTILFMLSFRTIVLMQVVSYLYDEAIILRV
jgi:hypothetical protein